MKLLSQGQPVIASLTSAARGYYEDWVKWSFNVDGNDRLSREIIQEKKYRWKQVYKERMGVKITTDGHGDRSIVSIDERIPYGCQVEYTRPEQTVYSLSWIGSHCRYGSIFELSDYNQM